MSARGAGSLPLSYFINRARILGQYRAFMRSALRLQRRDETMAFDIQLRVREAFRMETADAVQVRQRLAHGTRQLALLESLSDQERGKPINETADEECRPVWPWEK
eukprot:CAMPEP_0172628776 /NCGR_PEP_ID=MMETSP1068-20121228/163792_1 /TAXON_ID=35684 /ORGANISM="Pseudopedinella elastica, Strain CCMP716" /LENGTH=105 /DNA_ID=CAMNT_0013439115 /DNA_START=1 /DNA_END=318 /DNA_ORIENTATION=-